MGDIEEAVSVWFKNTQQAIRKGEKSLPLDHPSVAGGSGQKASINTKIDKLVAIFMKGLKARTPAASVVWSRANEDIVRVHAEGLEIGQRQKVIAKLFAALPEEEQVTWREKAQRACEDAAQDPNQCFLNQAFLTPLLAKLLAQFPGQDASQFGPLIMHLRLGLRDHQGMIVREQLTIGAAEGGISFAHFEGGPDAREEERWDKYLSESLPVIPPHGDARLLTKENGFPLLSCIDNSWNAEDLIAILCSYFDLIWQQTCGRNNGGLTIPWDDIKASPMVYLPSKWVTAGIIVDPATLNLLQLATLYDMLLQAQSGGALFIFSGSEDGEGNSGRSKVRPHVQTPIPDTPSRHGRRLEQIFPTPQRRTPSRPHSRQSSISPLQHTPQRATSRLPSLTSVAEEEAEGSPEDVTPSVVASPTVSAPPATSMPPSIDALPAPPTIAASLAVTASSINALPSVDTSPPSINAAPSVFAAPTVAALPAPFTVTAPATSAPPPSIDALPAPSTVAASLAVAASFMVASSPSVFAGSPTVAALSIRTPVGEALSGNGTADMSRAVEARDAAATVSMPEAEQVSIVYSGPAGMAAEGVANASRAPQTKKRGRGGSAHQATGVRRSTRRQSVKAQETAAEATDIRSADILEASASTGTGVAEASQQQVVGGSAGAARDGDARPSKRPRMESASASAAPRSTRLNSGAGTRAKYTR
ncbi:hypothetical protein GY45DRAFT_1436595 [Cubamyces sp. BRFM 1775]|nr:hypothetical protein GY45DRAFT_1436595 [Cubamyces sp. BRFM 1775]